MTDSMEQSPWKDNIGEVWGSLSDIAEGSLFHRVWRRVFVWVVLDINNNNIYLLQLGCHPVAVIMLHVYKTWNWLLINLSLEGYMRSM